MVSLQAWGFSLRATTSHVAFGYDPTRRFVFYIIIDHLIFIVFNKLVPKFFFINALYHWFAKKLKFILRYLRKIRLITV